jgi:hypothetical protein
MVPLEPIGRVFRLVNTSGLPARELWITEVAGVGFSFHRWFVTVVFEGSSRNRVSHGYVGVSWFSFEGHLQRLVLFSSISYVVPWYSENSRKRREVGLQRTKQLGSCCQLAGSQTGRPA